MRTSFSSTFHYNRVVGINNNDTLPSLSLSDENGSTDKIKDIFLTRYLLTTVAGAFSAIFCISFGTLSAKLQSDVSLHSSGVFSMLGQD